MIIVMMMMMLERVTQFAAVEIAIFEVFDDLNDSGTGDIMFKLIKAVTTMMLEWGNTAPDSAQLLKLKSLKCLVILTSDDNNHICNYSDDDDDSGAG